MMDVNEEGKTNTKTRTRKGERKNTSTLVTTSRFESFLNKYAERDSIDPTRLEFVESLTDGVQGYVGRLVDTETKIRYAYKVPKRGEYTTKHEMMVMKKLNALRKSCPNFCMSMGLVKMAVKTSFIFDDKHTSRRSDDDYSSQVKEVDDEILVSDFVDVKTDEDSNPFVLRKISAEPEECASMSENVDVLIMENIDDATNISKAVDILPTKTVYSVVKQTLCAIKLAQEVCRFTHYDLHTENVLLVKCPSDNVFVYKLDSGSYFVPSYGYFPVIIDFGMSYVGGMQGNYLNCSLNNTDAGCLSIVHDPFYDFRLFLTNITHDCIDLVETDQYVSFRRWFLRKYRPVMSKMSLSRGWDSPTEDRISMEEHVIEMIEDTGPRTFTFGENIVSTVGFINSTIKIGFPRARESPMLSAKRFARCVNILDHEIAKIETSVSSRSSKQFVFQCLIESFKDERVTELSSRKVYEDVIEAVRIFTKNFIHGMSLRIPMYTLDCFSLAIHFDKILFGLKELSTSVEKVYYNEMLREIDLKNEQGWYRVVNEEILDDMFTNPEFETPCTLTSKNNIYVFDSKNQAWSKVKLTPKQIKVVNDIPHEDCMAKADAILGFVQ